MADQDLDHVQLFSVQGFQIDQKKRKKEWIARDRTRLRTEYVGPRASARPRLGDRMLQARLAIFVFQHASPYRSVCAVFA
jgi:cytochrome c-type biogenesis protein CcmH/NrfG